MAPIKDSAEQATKLSLGIQLSLYFELFVCNHLSYSNSLLGLYLLKATMSLSVCPNQFYYFTTQSSDSVLCGACTGCTSFKLTFQLVVLVL